MLLSNSISIIDHTDLADAIVSKVSPAEPVDGQLWIDISVSPSVIRGWSEELQDWEIMRFSLADLDPETAYEINAIWQSIDNLGGDGSISEGEKLQIRLELARLFGGTMQSEYLPTIEETLVYERGIIFTTIMQVRIVELEEHPSFLDWIDATNELRDYLMSLYPRPWLDGVTKINPTEWSDAWGLFYSTLSEVERRVTEVLNDRLRPNEDYNGVVINPTVGLTIESVNNKITLNASEGMTIHNKIREEDVFSVDPNTGDIEMNVNRLSIQARAVATEDYVNDEMTEVNATLSVHGEAIEARVTSETFDELENRVTNNESTLEVHAEGISAAATQTDLDALTGRVSSNESTLNIHAEGIAARVTQADFDEFGEEIGSSIASIEASANEIELRVESTEGGLATNSATIAVMQDLIETKVSQTDFDELGNTVGENSSLIQQNATSIESKVSQTEFDEMGNRVSANESSIVQLSGEITSKVSQVDFDELGNEVSNNTTQISQLPGSIISTVRETITDPLSGEVSANTSAIEQNASDIALRVTQEVFDEVTGEMVTSEEFAELRVEVDGVTAEVHGENGILTQLSVLNGLIEQTVTQSVFDELTGVVTDHETRISQNSTSIESKVSQTDFNTLEGTVSNNTTQISQLPGAIISTVRETITDSLSDRVSSSESAIEQNATDIALRVTQTDFDEAQEAFSELRIEVDGITSTVSGEGGLTSQVQQLAGEISSTVNRVDNIDGQVSENSSLIQQNADAIVSKVTQQDIDNSLEGFAKETWVTSEINQTAGAIELRVEQMEEKLPDFLEQIGDIEELISYINESLDALDGLPDTLKDMADDNIITPIEKIRLLAELENIQAEHPVILGQAAPFVNVDTSPFVLAFNRFVDFVNPLLANMSVSTAVIGSELRNRTSDYVSERTLLLGAITEALNDLVDELEDSTNTRFSEMQITVDGIKTTVGDSESGLVSQVNQMAGLIESKVSQTVFDELSGTVTEHETSISQMQDRIEQTVTQTDLNEVGDRIGAAESSIVQLSNEITSKVSQTDFDELGNVVGNNSAQISQLPNAIISTVRETITDPLSGQVSTNTSAIEQNASAIALRVTQEEFDEVTGEMVPREEFAELRIEVDSIVQTVTGDGGLTTQLSVLNGLIDSKVSQSDFDELTESTNTRFSNVQQTTDEINSTVGEMRTDLDGKATVGALSEVSQKVDSITSRVTDPETGLESRVEQLSGEVNIKVTQEQLTDAVEGLATESFVTSQINVTTQGITTRVEEIERQIDEELIAQIEAMESILESTQEMLEEIDGLGLVETIQNVNDLSADDRLTPVEKLRLRADFDIILAERARILEQAAEFSTVSIVEYNAAFEALRIFVEPLLANMTNTTGFIGSQLRERLAAYANERTRLLADISRALEALSNALEGKLDTLEDSTNTRFAETQTTINGITSTVQGHDGRITTAQQTADSITQTVEGPGGITSQISQMQSDINLRVTTEQLDSATSGLASTEWVTSQINIGINSITTRVEAVESDLEGKATVAQFSEIQQTVNGINSTVQGHDGRITTAQQTADSITNTVTGPGGLSSQVQQLPGSITQTIRETITDPLTSRVTTAESQILANTQQIGLRVTSQQATDIANTQAQNAIDGLEIGGRNLIHNGAWLRDMASWQNLASVELSEDDHLGSPYAIWTVTGRETNPSSRTFWNQNRGEYILQPNQEYTLSGWVRVPSSTAAMNGTNTVFARTDDIGASGTELMDISFDFTNIPRDEWTYFEVTRNIGNRTRLSAIQFAINSNGTVHASHLMFTKGNKAPKDWIPAPEDAQTEIDLLQSRMSAAEIIIEADNITSIVMESNSFQNAMDEKADTEDLEGLATESMLDRMREDFGRDLSETERNANNFTTEAMSEVVQTVNAIENNFTQSGGVNYVRNSIGMSEFDFWFSGGDTTPVVASSTRVINTGLNNIGQGTGFALGLNSGAATNLSQRIPVSPNTQYTISWVLRKEVSPTAFEINLEDGDGTIGVSSRFDRELVDGSTNTNGWQAMSRTFTTPTNVSNLRIRLWAGVGTSAEITGLMLNVGGAPFSWTAHPQEIYSASVRMDINGIRVENNQFDGHTIMSPQEFAGYWDEHGDGHREEVFRMDRDEFVMKNAVIREEMYLDPIKILPFRDSGGNNGWAFIAS